MIMQKNVVLIEGITQMTYSGPDSRLDISVFPINKYEPIFEQAQSHGLLYT